MPVRAIASPEEAASVFPHALPVLHRPLARPPVAGNPDIANAPAVIAATIPSAAPSLARGLIANFRRRLGL